ncbi:MAG: EF-P lysine aminoacylase EpmA [Chlamydiales bacterium]|nr:EF-P lysine aminoacylase EpmA [Chlamydiales bacterium]
MTNSCLRLRAQGLAAARAFFAERKVLEVDCGALRRCPPLDANIDAMTVNVFDAEIGYLHTSPEYAMKKLLTLGSGDIYFLGHVYRKGELGPRHNPEFTMAEWYRLNYQLTDMIDETCQFLSLFTGNLPKRILSYQDAFSSSIHLDPETASTEDLLEAARQCHIDLPLDAISWGKNTLVHLLLTHVIEPQLGRGEMTVLTDYPPHEAALACVVEKKGRLVAERFEIYINGLELANGYHELSVAAELRERFENLNQERKTPYPLDEQFLSALETGLFPPCCGVSVGFDRALMIQYGLSNISEIIPFGW